MVVVLPTSTTSFKSISPSEQDVSVEFWLFWSALLVGSDFLVVVSTFSTCPSRADKTLSSRTWEADFVASSSAIADAAFTAASASTIALNGKREIIFIAFRYQYTVLPGEYENKV